MNAGAGEAVERSPAAPDALPAYVEDRPSGVWTAQFPAGSSVPVARGRARAYPGLVSEAPPTLPYYRAAREVLRSPRRVLDAGCGAGAGARILSDELAEVVGLDRDADAVAFATLHAPRAHIACHDLALPYEGGFDACVLVDVLGHAASPYHVLRSVRRSLGDGSAVLVAEAAAYPLQTLRPPARRAFSLRALTTLLSATGFEVEHWVTRDGTFLCALARAVDDEGARWLAHGAEAIAAGDADGAFAAYAEIGRLGRAPLRVEASLAEADLHLALGNGDGATTAYFRARELDPQDPRPLAGLAQIALAIGDHGDAVALAEIACRMDPTDRSAVLALALALDRAHRAEAATCWKTAASLCADELGVVARFAAAAAEHGDPGDGVRALERLGAYGEERTVDFHLAYARALASADRGSDAQLALRAAAALAPEDPAVHSLQHALLDAERR